jgi:hypothetical protein
MTAGTVKIEIPFDALVAAISGLSVEEKRRLMELLDDQLMEEEGGPEEEAAVAEARAQFEAGEYVTLDEYLASSH